MQKLSHTNSENFFPQRTVPPVTFTILVQHKLPHTNSEYKYTEVSENVVPAVTD